MSKVVNKVSRINDVIDERGFCTGKLVNERGECCVLGAWWLVENGQENNPHITQQDIEESITEDFGKSGDIYTWFDSETDPKVREVLVEATNELFKEDARVKQENWDGTLNDLKAQNLYGINDTLGKDAVKNILSRALLKAKYGRTTSSF